MGESFGEDETFGHDLLECKPVAVGEWVKSQLGVHRYRGLARMSLRMDQLPGRCLKSLLQSLS